MVYIATYTVDRKQEVARVIADRPAEGVAEWIRKHCGAETVAVKIDDNPTAQGEKIIRL